MNECTAGHLLMILKMKKFNWYNREGTKNNQQNDRVGSCFVMKSYQQARTNCTVCADLTPAKPYTPPAGKHTEPLAS